MHRYSFKTLFTLALLLSMVLGTGCRSFQKSSRDSDLDSLDECRAANRQKIGPKNKNSLALSKEKKDKSHSESVTEYIESEHGVRISFIHPIGEDASCSDFIRLRNIFRQMGSREQAHLGTLMLNMIEADRSSLQEGFGDSSDSYGKLKLTINNETDDKALQKKIETFFDTMPPPLLAFLEFRRNVARHFDGLDVSLGFFSFNSFVDPNYEQALSAKISALKESIRKLAPSISINVSSRDEFDLVEYPPVQDSDRRRFLLLGLAGEVGGLEKQLQELIDVDAAAQAAESANRSDLGLEVLYSRHLKITEIESGKKTLAEAKDMFSHSPILSTTTVWVGGQNIKKSRAAFFRGPVLIFRANDSLESLKTIHNQAVELVKQ